MAQLRTTLLFAFTAILILFCIFFLYAPSWQNEIDVSLSDTKLHAGSVLNLPMQPTSHTGSTITKQVMLSRDDVPNIMQWSRAVLYTEDVVEYHAHESMYELFYVLSGSGVMHIHQLSPSVPNISNKMRKECEKDPAIDAQMVILKEGAYVSVPPFMCHTLVNTHSESLVLLVLAVADE